MRAAFRSWIGVAAATTGIILLAAGWLLIQEPPPLQVRRLPHGMLLRLDGVTLGPEHRLVKGRYGQRWLSLLLPPTLQSHSGAEILTYRSINPPAIIFWASEAGRPPPPIPIPGTGWRGGLRRWYEEGSMARALVSDERGSQVAAVAIPILVPLAYAPIAGGLGMRALGYEQGWPLPAFPRRGRRLSLRIYRDDDPARGVPLAAFTVPNPDPGPHPTWTPEPLPAERRSGDLTFTLTHLDAEADPPDLSRIPWSAPIFSFQVYPHSWTRIGFRITRNGRPAPDWMPVGVTVSDATGNRMIPVLPLHYHQGDEAWLTFSSGLPPDESAWKLRAELAPTAGFAPPDLWTVERLAAPTGRQETSAVVTTTRHSVPITLGLKLRQTAVVEAQWTAPVDGLRIGLLRAIDDRGRAWLPDSQTVISFLPARREVEEHELDLIHSDFHLMDENARDLGKRRYLLRIPADVKSLALTFAVVRSRFVEYLARPSRPAPARPMRSSERG